MDQMKHQIHASTLITFTLFLILFSNLTITVKASSKPHTLMKNDAFIAPDIPKEHHSPITPGYYETSEYLIGTVAVGIILPESNGAVDPSTENWTPTEETNVVNKIQTALNWWQNQNPQAHVSFKYDTIHYRVPTRYEPIRRPSTDEDLWISDTMTNLGYPGYDYFTQVRDYINAIRTKLSTDWAFAIFVVDSSNDPNGEFTNGLFAYAYLGGPFLVMTYDNDGYGIARMDSVTAHETGHIFYATDEYDGTTEYSGYLNVPDVEGSGDLMDNNSWSLSSGTKGQIGWRDTDTDGTLDIVDTTPETTLSTYSPDPTSSSNLTYTGTVTEVPYPNNNPHGTGKDVTINTITNVQFSVDSEAWLNAAATDGNFDQPEENYNLTTPSLSSGTHVIKVRGTNSVGNTENSLPSDTVTVDTQPPTIQITSPQPVTYTNSSSVTATWNSTDAVTGVNHYEVMLDNEPWQNMDTAKTYSMSELTEGTHNLTVKAVDNVGNLNESWVTFTVDTTAPVIIIKSLKNGSEIRTPTLTLSWTGSDGISGIDHYQIRIDGKPWTSITANKTTFEFPQVNDGSHTVEVEAFDKAGNSRQTRINLIVNTSLIGGPGWTDDIIVFSVIGVAALTTVAGLFFFLKRRKKPEMKSQSAAAPPSAQATQTAPS